jgi:hypothetical protein
MASEIPPGTPSPSQRPCEREGEIRDFGGQRVGSGPCVDRNGETVRHSAYVMPSRGRLLVRGSTLAAVVLAALLPAIYFAAAPARPSGGGRGLRGVLSPAPTFSRHSLATLDCAQCHRAGHNAEDVRCERCHDAGVSARLSNAAHVFQGTADTPRALAAPAVACATCHLEHQGAEVRFADVDDRECGSCHRAGYTRLSKLTRHPEFALVREGVESGSALRWFNHKLHVAKVQTKFQQTCEACHQRSADGAHFAPISFQAHCRTCHEEDLSDSAGTMAAPTLQALGALPATLRRRVDLDDPARVGVSGVKHADRWILSAVQALRATYNPGAVAAERALIDRQIAQLELERDYGAPPAPSGAWTGLDATLRSPASAATSDGDGIRGAAAAVDAFVGSLPAQDDTTAALRAAAARLQQGGPSSPPAPAAAPVNVEPIRQLLQATLARANAAGNTSVAQRATDLLAQLDKIGGASRQPAAYSPAATSPLLQALALSGDPRVRAEARTLDDLAQLARRQAAGGIDPYAFDPQRRQILQLLSVSQQAAAARRQSAPLAGAADALLARLGALRRRVLGTDYRLSAETAAARAAFFQARQVDRARVDTELDAAGLRTAAPAERIERTERRDALQTRLNHLRLQLAALAGGPRITGVPAADARAAIAALLGAEASDAEQNSLQKNRCTLCHELAPGGDQLAPVRGVGTPLLTRARFTHAPHVTADNANCETCHTGIRASTAARELNLPNVASCITCHAPGKSAARAMGCESCHSYHVPASRSLVWMP